MRQSPQRWPFISSFLVGVALFAFAPLARHARAAQFLGRIAQKPAVSAKTSAESSLVIRELTLTIQGELGPIRARLYFRGDRPRGAGIVVAHGVHYRGIDEARLTPFVRALAESGLVVLTPELAELADYRITPASVSVIRSAVAYLASDHEHVDGDRVGLLGFSFAGGLSLVAAEAPETARRLSFVTSVGGHHDLRRVLRFLIHDEIETPAGIVSSRANEYGLVVLVYGNLEHFVPLADLETMRSGFKAWLQEDRSRARELAKNRTTPEADELWQLLETQRLQTLAPKLDALLERQREQLASLSSAGHLQRLGLPVYLLHGSHDTVIPPSETDSAGLELRSTDHQALVSPLLEHVEVNHDASYADKLALVSFMAHML
jgi:pimeloyl-ACP methyl ester carboxylesterase